MYLYVSCLYLYRKICLAVRKRRIHTDMYLSVSDFICLYLMYQLVSCVYLSVRMYLYVSVLISKYLYVSVSIMHVSACLHIFSPMTRKPQPRPQNASSWDGTRRAALRLRASQDMCANTLFCNRRSTRRLFCAPPRAARVQCP
jgi:hypothetical protein